MIFTVQIFNFCTSRPDVGQTKTPMDNMPKKAKHIYSQRSLRIKATFSYVKSSMNPCPGNWVVVGCAVVYYAWPVNAFSAGIKCRHCRSTLYPSRVYQFQIRIRLEKNTFVPFYNLTKTLIIVPTFNSCTKRVGSWGIIRDRTPDCYATQFSGHVCMDGIITELSFD